jgi:GNAT superfamily N-acetyltransferase
MSESNDQFIFKAAEEKDILLAVHFRRMLFREMGVPDESFIENVYDEISDLYQKELKEGRIRHFIAYGPEDQPVAIAGALLKNDFPYRFFKPGYYGWIIDVYTLPGYRGKGLSTRLLSLTHEWLCEKGVQEAKLISAGNDARRLYEKLGYRATWEMSFHLSGEKTYNELIDLKVGVKKE